MRISELNTLGLKLKYVCLTLANDSHILVRLKIFFGPFWIVVFFDSVFLAHRFITISNISVHSNTMPVYVSIRN